MIGVLNICYESKKQKPYEQNHNANLWKFLKYFLFLVSTRFMHFIPNKLMQLFRAAETLNFKLIWSAMNLKCVMSN